MYLEPNLFHHIQRHMKSPTHTGEIHTDTDVYAHTDIQRNMQTSTDTRDTHRQTHRHSDRQTDTQTQAMLTYRRLLPHAPDVCKG